jgi:hypothetical protein
MVTRGVDPATDIAQVATEPGQKSTHGYEPTLAMC